MDPARKNTIWRFLMDAKIRGESAEDVGAVFREVFRAAPAGGLTGHTYTMVERQQLRDAGKDPDLMEKVRGAANFADFKRRKDAATGGGEVA